MFLLFRYLALIKIKHRLEEFIKYLNIKNADFEKKVGLSNGYVNNLGDNIREKTLTKISETFSELDTNWLKTGIGTMIINNQNNSGIINNQNNSGHNKNSNNINGVNGNVMISHNEISNMIELQKGYQELQKELTDRLKTSQDQLTESQKQVRILLNILKNKYE